MMTVRSLPAVSHWVSEQAELLIENSQDLLNVIGPDHTILYSSPAGARLVGEDPSQSLGTDVLDYVHPEDRDEAARHIDEALAMPGLTVPFRVRVRDTSGAWRWFECLGTNLVDNPQIGGIVVNSRDVTEQVDQLEQIARTLRTAVETLANVVFVRDPYTARHQQQVARLSAGIARAMGLPESDVEGIEMAASLHDLGKLAVPAEILAAPRRLSEPELDLVRQHPQVGHDLLKGIDFPWPVAEMVLQHHERVDGSGYPNGLRGPDIDPGACIIAVADTVDAMTSHRPYRPGLGIDAALQEVHACRGVTLDPQVVDACVDQVAHGLLSWSCDQFDGPCADAHPVVTEHLLRGTR